MSMKYRKMIPFFGTGRSSSTKALFFCSPGSNILVEKMLNPRACRRYATEAIRVKIAYLRHAQMGLTPHFYQYSVPNGTSKFQKNFMELGHSVRNASLGRKYFPLLVAFRTETTFIDRRGDNASCGRMTFLPSEAFLSECNTKKPILYD
jgi:hypothetical protein